ncbi:ribonuclease BN [Streptomyces sp. SAS_270]|uniref:ribonuclease BN n=1 Tax=Streptomyces sp. SAS_270 TaxID=3412748 RepID=UPI00403C9700
MNRPGSRAHGGWQRLGLTELLRRGKELELLHRSMGFATFALVTLAPLLIVVAAADPLGHGGFALWLVDGMGLSGRSAHAVTHVVSPPRKVVDTATVWSVALLAPFGLAFASSVQNGYEKIWGLTTRPWHRIWRQTVWLGMLTLYLYLQVETRTVLEGTARIVLGSVTGLLFFWWGPRFLLGRRVRRRELLPGAVATMAGLVGLRWFSTLVFTPLVASNAISYGAVGTILVVESWFTGVGFVIYGGALLGRHLWHRFGPAEESSRRTEPDGPGSEGNGSEGNGSQAPGPETADSSDADRQASSPHWTR